MVTCNYHGINFHVYVLVYLKIYLFSRQLVNVTISSRIKGLALCYLFITSLNSYLYYSGYHELCILLTKGIVIFRNYYINFYISFKYCKYPSKCIARN